MNWGWATSLDQIWRSPTFPMWVTLAAAGFFSLIVVVTLLRAEKSVANGALTVITLLAVGIAVAATIRGYGPADRGATGETRAAAANAGLPALSCIDDLAGEIVLAACEKSVFDSPESTASAVNYAAAQITRLTALGNAASAENSMTPELRSLRQAVERDRYGLVAQVLQVREHCTMTQCAVFRSLTDSQQIIANMDAHVYDTLVARYAPGWNAPVPAPSSVALLPANVPTGRPTNAEFPSSASTPPVSIMTPEPGTGTPVPQRPAPAAASNALVPAPRPSPGPTTAAKKPIPKRPPPTLSAPLPISPTETAPAAAAD